MGLTNRMPLRDRDLSEIDRQTLRTARAGGTGRCRVAALGRAATQPTGTLPLGE